MIDFEKFELENGMKVVFHKDTTTPLAAVNLLYNVGSKDESEEKTGFAHLFEHLMFCGSANIPDFDRPLQMVGGENNAFTNNDYTNYYIILPKSNIETAFWLESDRMLSLTFSKKSLKTQKNVVIEEFKQRYLNQPYGDVWLNLRPLIYTQHPYKWCTIGKDISHIENANIEDVKDFFFKHYAPNNCIMSVVGDFELDYVKDLCNKWFGTIERREISKRNLPNEPQQTIRRELVLKRDVPFDSIYKAFPMSNRLSSEYYIYDLLSDILSSGDSSRLMQTLVKQRNMFSELDAYISGDIEQGAFIVSGKLIEGVKMEDAEKAIDEELLKICETEVSDYELEKVKNRIEANHVFSEIHILNKAMNLAYFTLLGNTNLINNEIDIYRKITKNDIQKLAKNTFENKKASVLYYYSNK